MRLSVIRWLRHHIEHGVTDVEFNMARFCTADGDCGTVGCMAGQMAFAAPRHIQNAWMAHQSGYKLPDIQRFGELARLHILDTVAHELARVHCGLTRKQSRALFAPSNVDYTYIERKDAVKVLSYLERCHQIDWGITPYAMVGYQPMTIAKREITP